MHFRVYLCGYRPYRMSFEFHALGYYSTKLVGPISFGSTSSRFYRSLCLTIQCVVLWLFGQVLPESPPASPRIVLPPLSQYSSVSLISLISRLRALLQPKLRFRYAGPINSPSTFGTTCVVSLEGAEMTASGERLCSWLSIAGNSYKIPLIHRC